MTPLTLHKFDLVVFPQVHKEKIIQIFNNVCIIIFLECANAPMLLCLLCIYSNKSKVVSNVSLVAITLAETLISVMPNTYSSTAFHFSVKCPGTEIFSDPKK